MKSTSTKREQRRLLELANEYRRKGFGIVVPTRLADVPPFLRELNYTPDLIATSDTETLVVEVKSAETRGSIPELSSIADAVNAREGWQFVLVMTNPKERAIQTSTVSPASVEQLIQEAEYVADQQDERLRTSAFVLSWVAAEAAVRVHTTRSDAEKQASLLTLIRDATIMGDLDRDDALRLERLYKVRSSILHGLKSTPIRQSDTRWLIGMARSLEKEAEQENKET